MFKRIAVKGRPTLDRLKIGALRQLMRSRLGLRLARAALNREGVLKPHDRISSDFFLELAQRAYADRSIPVV